VAIIWALNFSIVKVSLSEIDPYSFNVLRFIFATSLLWYFARQKGYTLKVRKKHFWKLVGIGIIGNLFYQLFFIIGINYTYAANAAVMLGTIPIWVALLSQFFTDEKLTLYKGAGVLFAFIGVAFIMIGGEETISFESETFLGNVITLAAAFCWGIYTILSRKYLRVYSPLQYSAFMSLIGLISLTVIGLPFLIKLDWSGISLIGFGGILYSGALSIGIAYIIWNNGVKKIGAVRTAAYQNLVPVLGLIFGLVLLGEELTVLQYIGAGSVIAGIILARKKTKTEQAKLSYNS
jgi:drug/metabolite transporter (DMT)-like permease